MTQIPKRTQIVVKTELIMHTDGEEVLHLIKLSHSMMKVMMIFIVDPGAY